MSTTTAFVFSLLIFLLSATLTLEFLDDVSESDLSAVKVRLSEEKSKRILLQNDVESLMLKVEELERKIKDLTRMDKTSTYNKVFFNAKLSEHTSLDSQHILVFDKVLDNQGSGYSSSTGIFRAPVEGLYQLSLTILSINKNQYAHIQLKKNDQEIGRIFAGDKVAAYGQMGTVTVSTILKENDEVYAREFPDYTGHVHGYDYSSFSGVLLQAD